MTWLESCKPAYGIARQPASGVTSGRRQGMNAQRASAPPVTLQPGHPFRVRGGPSEAPPRQHKHGSASLGHNARRESLRRNQREKIHDTRCKMKLEIGIEKCIKKQQNLEPPRGNLGLESLDIHSRRPDMRTWVWDVLPHPSMPHAAATAPARAPLHLAARSPPKFAQRQRGWRRGATVAPYRPRRRR